MRPAICLKPCAVILISLTLYACTSGSLESGSAGSPRSSTTARQVTLEITPSPVAAGGTITVRPLGGLKTQFKELVVSYLDSPQAFVLIGTDSYQSLSSPTTMNAYYKDPSSEPWMIDLPPQLVPGDYWACVYATTPDICGPLSVRPREPPLTTMTSDATNGGSAPPEAHLCETKGGGALTQLLGAFMSAYSDGDAVIADSFFAVAPDFQWYSDPPGRVDGGSFAPADRSSLRRYFELRHSEGDRLAILSAKVTANSGGLVHFAFEADRSVSNVATRHVPGKGAVKCPDAKIVVFSLGSESP